MILNIETRGFSLTPPLSEFTNSKVRLNLGLYREKIYRVDVFLTHENTRHDNLKMACKIKIKAKGYRTITICETGDNMYGAVSQCIHRAKRTVARRFNRMLQARKNNVNRQKFYDDFVAEA